MIQFFQTLKKSGSGVLLLLTINISFTQAQTDQCQSIGWANYNNTTFVGPVTGGGSATPVTVNTFAALEAAAEDANPRVIYVANVPGGIGLGSQTGGSRIDVKSNKTIIGMPGAVVKIYFHLTNVSNIIIRNLIFQGPGSEDVGGMDNMTIQTTSSRIWVDHCEFRDGQDGNFDIKNAANNVTVTWCKFSYTGISGGHRFSNLIGADDDHTEGLGKLKVTFQFNWWDEGCVERMPRVRFGQVHVVNNLYTSSVQNLGITAGLDADIRAEGNAFIGVDEPIDLGKMDGTAKITVTATNLFSGTTGNTAGAGGTAFTPPYTLVMAPASSLNTTTFKNCVGATLPAPSPGITCPCGDPLPVDIIVFTVKPLEESYLLNWLLAEDESLKNIGIEYSQDGLHFTSMTTLDKNANSFSIPMEAVLNNNIKYVRLKLAEEDGNHNYSPVKAIFPEGSYYVYPNPFTEKIYIHGLEEGTFQVFGMDGTERFQGAIVEGSPINLSHLSIGTYLLVITDHIRMEVKQFPMIKQ